MRHADNYTVGLSISEERITERKRGMMLSERVKGVNGILENKDSYLMGISQHS